MKIILTESISNLGTAGDIVNVAPGYGRNYLLPRGMAVSATTANLKVWEQKKQKLSKRVEAEKTAASELAGKLQSAPIRIETSVSGEGRLYGSVTTRDIAQAIHDQLGEDIDRKKIRLNQEVKEPGEYSVKIALYPEVTPELSLQVVSKLIAEAEAEAKAKAGEESAAAEAEAAPESAGETEAAEAPEAPETSETPEAPETPSED